jgi:hypothetical protein
VLFRQAKLRNAPFEWVYDGLAPALLPAVLAKAKGMPLSLALAAAGVGHRAGIALQLLCAPDQQQSSTQSGGELRDAVCNRPPIALRRSTVQMFGSCKLSCAIPLPCCHCCHWQVPC